MGINNAVNTGRKLNVPKTFNLRPVSKGKPRVNFHKQQNRND